MQSGKSDGKDTDHAALVRWLDACPVALDDQTRQAVLERIAERVN